MPIPSNKLFRDLYWVLPEQFLAGEYPGSYDSDQARQKLRWLLQAGVTLFLDLTEEGELPPYAATVQEEAAALGQPTAYRRMSIRDHSTPAHEQMAHILDAIDAALEAGHTAYVHCWGGIGRTGTVVGCYLARHGMSGEEALQHLAWLRRDTSDGGWASPETTAQEQMVRNWPLRE